MREGQALRERADRLRTPLFEPGGALGELHAREQDRLKQKAMRLAEVFQRSSSNVEGRNGYLSLRNHELRGLDYPRKRVCLTAVHNFLLTRSDGTDVCRDTGVSRDSPCSPQSSATSRGLGEKGVGWPTR